VGQPPEWRVSELRDENGELQLADYWKAEAALTSTGLTEAEYAALLPCRMERLAHKATAALPDWMQDAGLRFERRA
jgi:hypothetical protein